MSTSQTYVIVGAAFAGAKAAETLREEGSDGRVVLLGEEDVRPYERPPLSKDYLRGEAGDDAIWVHDAGFYADNDVELRTGVHVTELALAASEVVLEGGERIGFDKLLLATGAAPRRLRTVHDSDRLREALANGGRLVVIGAGWIGAEVAASARQKGVDVTLLAQ